METAERAILFADVTDSTRIYESLGDTKAPIILFSDEVDAETRDLCCPPLPIEGQKG